MISTAPCKINLGLQVISLRNDNFHELETLFYPTGWSDLLEVIAVGNVPFDLTFSGLKVPGSSANNLCYRAWELLSKDYLLPNLKAHLHKIVPMGAGLGGGSSDAAFMLKLINQVVKLNISEEKLKSYAALLGSDCPFFIDSRPCLAKGRGELLFPTDITLKGYYMVIVMPEVTVGTAEAYRWITPKVPQRSIAEIIQLPIQEWQGLLLNDFEEPVASRFPIIREIRESLLQHGAIYASMSGSGAAVFGIFKEEINFSFSNSVIWKGPCEY
ncbi:4-(cytidine 5'-diphospho)-2-C-methyl-D-erythritol kinase [soil metagenome]